MGDATSSVAPRQLPHRGSKTSPPAKKNPCIPSPASGGEGTILGSAPRRSPFPSKHARHGGAILRHYEPLARDVGASDIVVREVEEDAPPRNPSQNGGNRSRARLTLAEGLSASAFAVSVFASGLSLE